MRDSVVFLGKRPWFNQKGELLQVSVIEKVLLVSIIFLKRPFGRKLRNWINFRAVYLSHVSGWCTSKFLFSHINRHAVIESKNLQYLEPILLANRLIYGLSIYLFTLWCNKNFPTELGLHPINDFLNRKRNNRK